MYSIVTSIINHACHQSIEPHMQEITSSSSASIVLAAKKTVYSKLSTHFTICLKFASLVLLWQINRYFPPKLLPLVLPNMRLQLRSPLLFNKNSSRSFQEFWTICCPETQKTTSPYFIAVIVNRPSLCLLFLLEIPTLIGGHGFEVKFWLMHNYEEKKLEIIGEQRHL